ncbi:Fc.00g108440.m01.CDS01 [Cosmosporella sp. VM-42]
MERSKSSSVVSARQPDRPILYQLQLQDQLAIMNHSLGLHAQGRPAAPVNFAGMSYAPFAAQQQQNFHAQQHFLAQQNFHAQRNFHAQQHFLAQQNFHAQNNFSAPQPGMHPVQQPAYQYHGNNGTKPVSLLVGFANAGNTGYGLGPAQHNGQQNHHNNGYNPSSALAQQYQQSNYSAHYPTGVYAPLYTTAQRRTLSHLAAFGGGPMQPSLSTVFDSSPSATVDPGLLAIGDPSSTASTSNTDAEDQEDEGEDQDEDQDEDENQDQDQDEDEAQPFGQAPLPTGAPSAPIAPAPAPAPVATVVPAPAAVIAPIVAHAVVTHGYDAPPLHTLSDWQRWAYFRQWRVPGPSEAERPQRNAYLVACRRKLEIPFGAIGRALRSVGWTGAISTLRGQYRTLIKPPALRPRKPKWNQQHLESLFNAAQAEGRRLGVSVITANTKVRWGHVAQIIKIEAGYEFGPSACRNAFMWCIAEIPQLARTGL